ncbi:MAG: ABC transporter substrate-binding protein [Planctomycetaceae bacterium]|nr:ABC transporter substrate-binding protein [Planctomycetaceae bacterium]
MCQRQDGRTPPADASGRRPLSALVSVLLASLISIGCGATDNGPGEDSENPQIVLALNWFPEAEHGGYLAASHLGLYKAAGLDVEVRNGGGKAAETVIKELTVGRIQFAISSADLVIEARAAGAPIVALAAPLQHSPRCIMVHEAAGFERLEDLSGVELAISDQRGFAMWLKHKVPLTDVTFVPFSGGVGEFVLKDKFAQQAYTFSEPFSAREKESDPQTLMLSDIGYDPYTCILVTTEEMIASQPEMVRAMVATSVEGWSRYLADPVATNEYITTINPEMGTDMLAFGVEAMKPLLGDEGTGCGMKVSRWETMIGQLEEIGKIEAGAVQAEDCFNASFLP